MASAPDRPLFKYLSKHQAGPVFNRFLRPLREGITSDPQQIVVHVTNELKADLKRRESWPFAAEPSPLRAVLLAIMGHPTDALALAQEAIDYHELPPEALAEHKAARSEEGRRQSMATKPPTAKQIAYLQSLGVATAPANRWEASQMIDARRKGARR